MCDCQVLLLHHIRCVKWAAFYGLSAEWKPLVEEEGVWLAMGCHPKNAAQYDEQAESGMRRALLHRKAVALGEIGLDYSRQ